MADIRNFIGFSQNENLIKEYDSLRMYYPVRAKIGIAVTSKRLIVYSMVRSYFDQKTQSLYQQVSIDDIKGIGIVQSFRYRPGVVAAGIVVLLLGVLAAVIGMTGSTTVLLMGGIGGSILGIILAALGFFWKKDLFRFEIWGTAWVLSIGEFENIRPNVSAGPDLQKVVEELGAILTDIREGVIFGHG